jgi:hypothetical protein
MKKYLFLLLLNAIFLSAYAQEYRAFDSDTVKAGRFDNGKMWTFDNPPFEYWKKTYDFEPDQKWMDFVRMSALRLPGCTGSFVSASGLVMTNHHCARDAGTENEKPGDNFTENGFFAKKAGDERPLKDYYIDQLQKLEDVTARVQAAMNKAGENDQITAREAEFKAIKDEFAKKTGWTGLELQTLTFYSGGKYALYGFKRYTDIRLVFMPELQLGLFGGEPDNFSYPRYCLDMSFVRVYDNGKPLDTKANFFKFNTNGVAEGTTTFVIGNPGSTSRIRTVADLQFDRDLGNPDLLELLRNRKSVLDEIYKKTPSDGLLNEIFGLSNSIEAISGQQKGLQDPYLMARRQAFENEFKAAAEKKNGKDALKLWDDIAAARQESRKLFPVIGALSTSDFSCGHGFSWANLLVRWAELTKAGNTAVAGQLKNAILEVPADVNKTIDEGNLMMFFKEAEGTLGKNDDFIKEAMVVAKTTDWAVGASRLMQQTKLYDLVERQKLLDGGVEAVMNSLDPMMKLANLSRPRFTTANEANKILTSKLTGLRTKLAKSMFDIYGTNIPPDATFSLRINDGQVKSYEYNGTEAICKTTFYGMYDRYYGHNKQAPWNLPARWQMPNPKILAEPLDFVTTNDIIGGNSGSAVINTKGEAIGLIFDGNPESLPGSYMYDPTHNRAVAVHVGGMIAAMKHVYKAKRLYKELLGE